MKLSITVERIQGTKTFEVPIYPGETTRFKVSGKNIRSVAVTATLAENPKRRLPPQAPRRALP